MSTVQFTPAPWAVHLGFELDTGEISPLHIFTDDGQGNGLPIPFRDDDRDAPIARANKSLIEAAPVLLPILIKAHRWILNDDADRFGPAETTQWNRLLDEIEDAIAKAEGR